MRPTELDKNRGTRSHFSEGVSPRPEVRFTRHKKRSTTLSSQYYSIEAVNRGP